MFRQTLIAISALAAVPATAASITYGGIAAPGGGFTTSLTGPNVQVQTFNGTGNGCGLSGGWAASGNYHIVTGSVAGYYAAPAGDTTCYMAVPQNGSSGVATVDISALLAGSPKRANYFGLYWGSIDTYNQLEFYMGNTLRAVVTGGQVLASFGIAGDQSASGSNRYVNIALSPSEAFDRIRFVSTNRAFELDNIAIRTAPVPEPGTVGLLGGALALLAFGRRRKAQSKAA
jgi:hypothetical protein